MLRKERNSAPNSIGFPIRVSDGKPRHSLIHRVIPHFIQIVYPNCQQICATFGLAGGADTRMRSTHNLEARPHRRIHPSVGTKESPKVNKPWNMYSRQLHSRQLRSQLLPIREYRRGRQIIVKPEVIVKVSAIYLDTQGTEYSCYVTRTDHGFMLATAHGLRPITFYIEGSDVAGGYVQFLDYRFERQPGLRVCDYF